MNHVDPNHFYPATDREAEILRILKNDMLEAYKRSRHGGTTVTEAAKEVAWDALKHLFPEVK